MELEVRWMPPFEVVDGYAEGLIYSVKRFKEIPHAPGVYVFSRLYGDSVAPLYIGKAEDLSRRILQQLAGNVRLMRAIEDATNGPRRLHVAQLIGRRGQVAKKAVAVIESALISSALIDGFELINIKGTKTPAHTITSSGNREARSWLPGSTIRSRKA